MKSLLVSVFFPVWMWLGDPSWRVLSASYALKLALRDNLKARDIIQSEWFRDTFGAPWALSSSQNVKGRYANTEQGERLAVSVGSAVTGFRGNCIIVDDPLNAMASLSAAKRETATTWLGSAMSTRLNDLHNDAIIIVMQRLHEDDPTGHFLKSGHWEHLCLPSEYDPARHCKTSIGWEDPRTEEGELLFPEKFPQEVLDELKDPTNLGARGYANQHNQESSPDDGDLFRRSWWKYYDVQPDRFDQIVQSWDCAFKDLDTSDFVVGQVWGKIGATFYLLDQVRAKLTIGGTMDAMRNMHAKWSQARAIYVEDKANGTAVMQLLRKEIPGLIAVNPQGGKEARANAASRYCEAGNIYLPRTRWVHDFVEECAKFPTGSHDDQVDAMTQAIIKLTATRKPGIRKVKSNRRRR